MVDRALSSDRLLIVCHPSVAANEKTARIVKTAQTAQKVLMASATRRPIVPQIVSACSSERRDHSILLCGGLCDVVSTRPRSKRE